MGSIIKMFKANKKHGNKENMPTVSFNTSSLKKSTKPALSDFVYTGEPSKNVDLRLKSPYAVVTAPKTTRGPRSCPGAPMDDYEPSKKLNSSMLVDRKNVMRIDNPREKEKRRVKDDSELIQQRKSEFMNGRMNSDELAYRNMIARQQYDVHNTYESDEDEVYEARIRSIESRNAHLESKLQKMHRRMNEERSTMTRQIEILQEENYRLKKSHDRMHRQYSQMKTQIEVERKQKSDLLKMLHDANNKIDLLEAGCEENENDESVNTSSLLLPYAGGNYQATDMERSSEGAGEALCFPESLTISSSSQPFGVYGNMGQTLIVNSMPNSMKDDMDTHDEVRIFRTGAESSDGDSSPIEMSRHGMERMNVKQSLANSGEVTRSHSDSDLMTIQSPRRTSLTEFEQPRNGHRAEEIEKPNRIQYSRHSAWLKKNSKNMDDDLSTSSSEEERMSLIDRQLKKKGGLVKFNPPRQTIQAKHYKRFGKMERTALAEFEYLQDMSTDVSGMMSSPEVNQLVAMSNSFPPRH